VTSGSTRRTCIVPMRVDMVKWVAKRGVGRCDLCGRCGTTIRPAS
jgi:hypothetical protein